MGKKYTFQETVKEIQKAIKHIDSFYKEKTNSYYVNHRCLKKAWRSLRAL